MRTRTCGAVRRQLSAYHDRELDIDEQIALESHLRACAGCRLEARQLESLSSMIRVGALATTRPDHGLDAFASNLVSRMKAERAESLTGQTRALFDDLHLVWAALGATGATVACLAIVFTLFYFATHVRPDSLGAIIASMSSPSGSNQNPVAQMDDSLRLPSAVDEAFPAAVTHDEDAVFALAAVVTREGQIKNLNLLHGSDGTGPAMTAQERRDIETLLDTISKARFEPARQGNSPVAVNMVWLYAHVNVRGKVPAGSKLQSPAKDIIAALPAASSRAV
jgi:Putative zinc-finger